MSTSQDPSGPTPFRIQVENVHMAFPFDGDPNGTEVLGGISFSVEGGSLVSILGPSGCGKTTLIKILAGLLAPTKGTVKINGHAVTGPSPDQTVIFQEYGLFEWRTVIENVEFGLKARGLARHERHQIARRYLELVHLKGSERKYPNELSGGMKQRAAIARALAVDPQCVLMDEPFAALDSQTRLLLQEEILEIWVKTQKTILLITHNVEEAVFLSDRILVLSNIPAGIVLDIDITEKLHRPRSSELRFNVQFREIAELLWQTLRAQVASS